jgi:hypothetical protein
MGVFCGFTEKLSMRKICHILKKLSSGAVVIFSTGYPQKKVTVTFFSFFQTFIAKRGNLF